MFAFHPAPMPSVHFTALQSTVLFCILLFISFTGRTTNIDLCLTVIRFLCILCFLKIILILTLLFTFPTTGIPIFHSASLLKTTLWAPSYSNLCCCHFSAFWGEQAQTEETLKYIISWHFMPDTFKCVCSRELSCFVFLTHAKDMSRSSC